MLVAAAALAGAVLALVAAGGEAVWEGRSDETAPGDRGKGAGGAATAPAPPTRLIVTRDGSGRVNGLTAVVPEPDGTGGTMILVPVGTMVEVPSFGLEPVGRAEALGGLAALQQSMENLLGLRFGEVVVLDPEGVSAIVQPFGELAVDVPDQVEQLDGRGRVTVLFRQGRVALRPADVPSLLDAPGQSTDLGRLVRHQAFWRAWIGAAGERDDLELPGRESLARLARELAAGDVRFDVLPVAALTTGLEGDRDLYQVDRDGLRALLDRVASHVTARAAEGRIAVQLLNGAGTPGLAQRLTPALVAAGAEVKLVGNADRFDYDTTQVVYYDPAKRRAAEAVRDALGVGQVVFSRRGLSVVDVTVVAGTDLAGKAGAEASDPREGE